MKHTIGTTNDCPIRKNPILYATIFWSAIRIARGHRRGGRSLVALEHPQIVGHRCQRLQPLLLHDDKTARDRKSESTFMNSSTHDKAEGTAKEAVGKVKEKTGKAIGNQDLQDRGSAENVGGKVERKVGEVKKVFGK